MSLKALSTAVLALALAAIALAFFGEDPGGVTPVVPPVESDEPAVARAETRESSGVAPAAGRDVVRAERGDGMEVRLVLRCATADVDGAVLRVLALQQFEAFGRAVRRLRVGSSLWEGQFGDGRCVFRAGLHDLERVRAILVLLDGHIPLRLELSADREPNRFELEGVVEQGVELRGVVLAEGSLRSDGILRSEGEMPSEGEPGARGSGSELERVGNASMPLAAPVFPELFELGALYTTVTDAEGRFRFRYHVGKTKECRLLVMTTKRAGEFDVDALETGEEGLVVRLPLVDFLAFRVEPRRAAPPGTQLRIQSARFPREFSLQATVGVDQHVFVVPDSKLPRWSHLRVGFESGYGGRLRWSADPLVWNDRNQNVVVPGSDDALFVHVESRSGAAPAGSTALTDFGIRLVNVDSHNADAEVVRHQGHHDDGILTVFGIPPGRWRCEVIPGDDAHCPAFSEEFETGRAGQHHHVHVELDIASRIHVKLEGLAEGGGLAEGLAVQLVSGESLQHVESVEPVQPRHRDGGRSIDGSFVAGSPIQLDEVSVDPDGRAELRSPARADGLFLRVVSDQFGLLSAVPIRPLLPDHDVEIPLRVSTVEVVLNHWAGRDSKVRVRPSDQPGFVRREFINVSPNGSFRLSAVPYGDYDVFESAPNEVTIGKLGSIQVRSLHSHATLQAPLARIPCTVQVRVVGIPEDLDETTLSILTRPAPSPALPNPSSSTCWSDTWRGSAESYEVATWQGFQLRAEATASSKHGSASWVCETWATVTDGEVVLRLERVL